MTHPNRDRWSRRAAKAWGWLWRDARRGERVVVVVAVLAVAVAAGFAVHAALTGGPCHCGP